MTPTPVRLIVLSVLGWPLFAGGGEQTISVRFYDYAQVPAPVLAKAQAQVGWIFENAGVRIRFVDCSQSAAGPGKQPRCAALKGPAQVTLMIKPKSMGPSWSRSEAELGSALLSDTEEFASYAYVFFDRVEKRAKLNGCSLPAVLATAMAHEIGHLLLGVGEHSSTGIMRGVWKRKHLKLAETGALHFTPRQAKKLRTRVEQRVLMAAR